MREVLSQSEKAEKLKPNFIEDAGDAARKVESLEALHRATVLAPLAFAVEASSSSGGGNPVTCTRQKR